MQILRLTIVILVIISQNNFAQKFENKITGKVTIEKSKEPIPNANIYLSGTLFGTISDNNGNFSLESIYPGEHEIVVSVIGFKSISKIVRVTSTLIKTINFKLSPKEYDLETVEVTSDKPEEWLENLELFKSLFIGRSENAEECEIKNEVHLQFVTSSKNLFVANINQPLIIVNHSLGYEIRCELREFTYNKSSYRLKYIVNTFFKELEPEDEDQYEDWIDNRLETYVGSPDHFIRSFYYSNFIENGYKVDQSRYPLKEGCLYHNNLLTSEGLINVKPNSNTKTLKFNNYLQITNMHNLGGPRPISWISLLYDEVTFDKNGYIIELIPFEMRGYWTILGLADMLPKYYALSIEE